jgi:hypothetical protein
MSPSILNRSYNIRRYRSAAKASMTPEANEAMMEEERRDGQMANEQMPRLRCWTVVWIGAVLLVGGLLCASGASAQEYPMLDRVAAKVVQKYQTSSCQQLAEQRQQRPTGQREEMEERVIRLLHEDPRMRQEFINRVAAPIANKLFECGLIP